MTTFLVFVDVNEDLVMTDDAIVLSNPLVAPIKEEELEETSFDVNVSQRSCDKKPFERVVCIRVDRSAWDRQLFPNSHALVICL